VFYPPNSNQPIADVFYVSPFSLHYEDLQAIVFIQVNVGGGNGTRYQCRDNVWSLGSGGQRTFIYKTQYYLEVVSPYGTPSGSDWYDESTTVQARLATNTTAGPKIMLTNASSCALFIDFVPPNALNQNSITHCSAPLRTG
jgi:hypothetical protein